jgi:hypothetical protein
VTKRAHTRVVSDNLRRRRWNLRKGCMCSGSRGTRRSIREVCRAAYGSNRQGRSSAIVAGSANSNPLALATFSRRPRWVDPESAISLNP